MTNKVPVWHTDEPNNQIAVFVRPFPYKAWKRGCLCVVWLDILWP